LGQHNALPDDGRSQVRMTGQVSVALRGHP